MVEYTLKELKEHYKKREKYLSDEVLERAFNLGVEKENKRIRELMKKYMNEIPNNLIREFEGKKPNQY